MLLTDTCAPVADGDACEGANGTCYDGACCTGCWDGARCLDGTDTLACGGDGRTCESCSGSTNLCAADHCVIERRVVSLSVAERATAFVDGLGALWTMGEAQYLATCRSDAAALGKVGDDGMFATVDVANPDFTPFSLATSSDGALWTCGNDGDSELADAVSGSRATIQQVDAGPWQSLGAGTAFGCGVRTDGTLWCWGWNGNNRLAQATSMSHSVIPLQVGTEASWRTVVTNDATGCAIKQDDTLWCWGGEPRGRTATDILAPVEPATSWSTVALGADHACGVRLDGTLWCWGGNARGQLGLPVASTQVPMQVGQDTTWARVAAGTAMTCATRSDHSLWCWGNNDVGQLGTGDQTSAAAPLRVGARSDWELLSIGTATSCATNFAGELYCWGAGFTFAPSLVLFPR